VGLRRAGAVAQLGIDAQRPFQVGVGVLVVAEPGVGVPELPVGEGVGRPVTEPLGGGQGDLLGGDPVVPVPQQIQEPPQRPGDLPRVGIKALLQRLSRRGHQHLALGLEPGLGLSDIAQALRFHARLRRGQGDRPAGGVDQQRRRARGVQVVVEHPCQSRSRPPESPRRRAHQGRR
jgi:hypothetical protein